MVRKPNIHMTGTPKKKEIKNGVTAIFKNNGQAFQNDSRFQTTD